MWSFQVDSDDEVKISRWLLEEVYPAVRTSRGLASNEEIYEGAIGGGLTYEFTPTGLGTAFKVVYQAGFDRDSGKPLRFELDLTHYEDW